MLTAGILQICSIKLGNCSTTLYVPNSPILLAGTDVSKISTVAYGFSSIKIDILIISRINDVYVFSIKYRYSDIFVKKNLFIYNRLFCCNNTCYCVEMVSVTSASRYHPHYQSRSSMYIRGLNP